MNSPRKVVSILRNNDTLIEKYFENFITIFHSSNANGYSLRKFIRNVGVKMIRSTAKSEAHSVMANGGGDINDKRMLYILEERIYQYLLEYRQEYLYRIQIIVNDILG